MPSHTVRAAIEDLRDQYLQHVDRMRDDLFDMMTELSDRGKARMIEILEAAVTQTGFERAMQGGHPGRVESGAMRDAIESDADIDGDEIVAEWGWLEMVKAYFLLQEHGSEVFGVQFEGMNALRGSYIEMREELLARLKGMS
jgi:hypothetical protein